MKKSVLSILALLIVWSVAFTGTAYAAKDVNRKELIDFSKDLVGTPYKYGGTSPKGFDCSGFLTYVYNNFDISLPRSSADQYDSGEKIKTSELQPGDLVFFSTVKKGVSHAGIYVGNDKFIHSSSSKGVMISDLDDNYWGNRYVGASRYIESSARR